MENNKEQILKNDLREGWNKIGQRYTKNYIKGIPSVFGDVLENALKKYSGNSNFKYLRDIPKLPQSIQRIVFDFVDRVNQLYGEIGVKDKIAIGRQKDDAKEELNFVEYLETESIISRESLGLMVSSTVSKSTAYSADSTSTTPKPTPTATANRVPLIRDLLKQYFDAAQRGDNTQIDSIIYPQLQDLFPLESDANRQDIKDNRAKPEEKRGVVTKLKDLVIKPTEKTSIRKPLNQNDVDAFLADEESVKMLKTLLQSSIRGDLKLGVRILNSMYERNLIRKGGANSFILDDLLTSINTKAIEFLNSIAQDRLRDIAPDLIVHDNSRKGGERGATTGGRTSPSATVATGGRTSPSATATPERASAERRGAYAEPAKTTSYDVKGKDAATLIIDLMNTKYKDNPQQYEKIYSALQNLFPSPDDLPESRAAKGLGPIEKTGHEQLTKPQVEALFKERSVVEAVKAFAAQPNSRLANRIIDHAYNVGAGEAVREILTSVKPESAAYLQNKEAKKAHAEIGRGPK